MFHVKTLTERNCELRLKRELDYETVKNYEVVIRLKSSTNLMDEDKTTARVILSRYKRKVDDYICFSVTRWPFL